MPDQPLVSSSPTTTALSVGTASTYAVAPSGRTNLENLNWPVSPSTLLFSRVNPAEAASQALCTAVHTPFVLVVPRGHLQTFVALSSSKPGHTSHTQLRRW